MRVTEIDPFLHWSMQISLALRKGIWKYLSKSLKTSYPLTSVIPTLGIYLQEIMRVCSGTYHRIIYNRENVEIA